MQESTRVQMTYISLSDNACEGLCGRPQRRYNIMQQEFLPVCVYWIIIPALARLSHKFSVVFKACSTVPRWPSKQFQDIWNIGFKSYVCLLWHMIAVTIKYSKTLLLLLLSRFGHRGLHRGGLSGSHLFRSVLKIPLSCSAITIGERAWSALFSQVLHVKVTCMWIPGHKVSQQSIVL